MRRVILFLTLATPFFFLLASNPYLYPQGEGAGGKTKPHEIEGNWSLVFREQEGVISNFLPQPAFREPGMNGNLPTLAQVWTFSKDKIDVGYRENFLDNYTYELNPGGKNGAIDIAHLGRTLFYLGKPIDGEETVYDPPIKSQAIYWIKDDWLFLCEGPKTDTLVRPDSFVTAGMPAAARTLSVFRRGVLELN